MKETILDKLTKKVGSIVAQKTIINDNLLSKADTKNSNIFFIKYDLSFIPNEKLKQWKSLQINDTIFSSPDDDGGCYRGDGASC